MNMKKDSQYLDRQQLSDFQFRKNIIAKINLNPHIFLEFNQFVRSSINMFKNCLMLYYQSRNILMNFYSSHFDFEELNFYNLKLKSSKTMSDSSEYSSEESQGWIRWFCNLEDHQFFCKVDEQYITDNFNLYGLKQAFDHYNDALEMILSPDPPSGQQLQDQRYLAVYQEATDLYGLIHARFILTPKGLSMMREKYLKGTFGICPRVLCQRQHVLPIGMSQQIRTSRVKIFCPRCQEVYMPKKKCHDVDGAYFGCSFSNILLVVYPDLAPKPLQTDFIPKIYGFKIYGKKGSKYEDKKQKKELTYYTQEQLKKLKTKNQSKKQEMKQNRSKYY